MYGLLDEVPQFRKASHLYICEPENLSERWMYIEEMKKLRDETMEVNKKKAEKHQSKKKAAKEVAKNESEKPNADKGSASNSQNVSYDNSQNVGYNNSQNVSKIYSKGFKFTLNPKSTLNLSISEDMENSSLPIPLLKILNDRIDRLIEFKLKISDIELHFNAVKEIYEEPEYGYVLSNLIDKMTFTPKNFADVMDNWLKRNRDNQNEVPDKKALEKKYVREEVMPDELKEELEAGEQQAAVTVEELNEQKKALQEKWEKWKTKIR
ncbi:hypothetical protein [Peribacillus frigoritolerans]|uniref:hypothetical protein n=1 Tax=Peribacillus frigoritolerans TaxID=450367 RepID=UPI002079674F|nr:hypothetical protein [Peribacillus frigoritolerans]USK77718.1 hypothetical protein LIT31_26545 [Peribacillus frigoritolerans]